MKDERHSRQSFLGPGLVSSLETTRIAVIGLCGGGSHIAQQLAHIGFRNVVLVDPDTTDLSNVNRMVGLSEEDARNERPKTEVVSENYLRVLPDAQIVRVEDPWENEQHLLKTAHVIIGCVDSYTAREAIERFCRRYLIAYVDLGMDVAEAGDGFIVSGQVITSVPGGPCMRCLGFLTDGHLAREAEAYGAVGGRPQVVWPNGVLASTAIGQVMQLLLPWGPGVQPSPYLVYDANRHLLGPSSRIKMLADRCEHYANSSLGDVAWPRVVNA